jgi:hypothetical protein
MASAVVSHTSLATTRFTGSPLDLPKRAHALLAERFPAARVRHKPLSILRQEARRALEQFLDAQQPPMGKPERDRLIDDVLGEAPGFGPLEELFRDESVKEIMLLAAAQVIAKKETGWVPTSVRFRDAVHHRAYVRRLAETGEPLAANSVPTDGAFDVRLANGFRVIGVTPPDVLDQPPLAVFVRGQASPVMATPGPVGLPIPQGGSGVTTIPLSRIPAIPKGGSSVVSMNELVRGPSASGRFPKPNSEPPRPSPLPMPEAAPVSEFYIPAHVDAKERTRRKVSERIIRKCAAAGVYDLSAIPAVELQRVILAHVEELNAEQGQQMSDHEMQITALEIFTGMRR